MQPIQLAVPVSVSVRATVAMIVALAVSVLVPRALIAPSIAPPTVPPPTVASAELIAEAVDGFDVDWFHADYLARSIEARRYGAIEAAAAAIHPASRYSPWVPAAVALAIDQLEATATAYARMGMCGELGRLYQELEDAWPQGSAAMRHIYCETRWVCGTAIRQMQIEKEQGYAGLVDELAAALAAGDHTRALGTCGAMHEYGAIPATCLAEACNAGELALAEVLYSHLVSRRSERIPHVTDGDVAARRACERAGIWFDRDGTAHVRPPGVLHRLVPWHAYRAQPVELVRVHPEAPPVRTSW